MPDLILDPWTPLAYKGAFGDPATNTPAAYRNAPWLTETDRRRLSAYMVLAAYAENTAREFLPPDNDRRGDAREYGDPSLVIEQALSSLMGESQTINVDRADEYDAKTMKEGVTPEEGAADDDALDPEDVADIREALWWQDRLREWADKENAFLTMLAAERDAVTVGDGVYVVSWDPAKERVRLMNVDPGLYFPAAPTGGGLSPNQYADRVDFLWSTPAEPAHDIPERVTRLTYRLGPIQPVIDDDGLYVATEDGGLVLAEGDRWETRDAGTPRERYVIVRDVPWSDEPVEETCYLDQVTWNAADIGRITPGAGVAAISTADAVSVSTGQDLRIDFVPVVHVPNTWPGAHVYGQAVITKATQVLDDLQNADTDTQAAASTTGSPIIAVSGGTVVAQRGGIGPGRDMGTVPTFDVRPGMVLSLAADGRLSTVDTSAQLGAMREYVEDLRGRFTQNVRIPDVALGLVGDSANDMSGLAIELRYGPMQSLIRGMRQVRAAKYPVLLRFVQRLMMLADGWDGPDETARAEVLFGSFMPRDLEGALARVTAAYQAGVISLETAVLTLQQAGMPIEDAAAEVERIRRHDYKNAALLADATGDVAAVRDVLGLEPQTIVPNPAVTTLPATGR